MPQSFRFVAPEPRLEALPRPRLLRRLLGRWDHPVTCLTGGPGLGKTTLLAQAIKENRLAPRGQDVWVRVGPQHEDAAQLAVAMLDALGGEVGYEPGGPGDFPADGGGARHDDTDRGDGAVAGGRRLGTHRGGTGGRDGGGTGRGGTRDRRSAAPGDARGSARLQGRGDGNGNGNGRGGNGDASGMHRSGAREGAAEGRDGWPLTADGGDDRDGTAAAGPDDHHRAAVAAADDGPRDRRRIDAAGAADERSAGALDDADVSYSGAAWIADAMWRHAPADACLVLDDVHLLPARSSGTLLLSRLIHGLPANGHVVLASRSTPPVPLSRLRTEGSVLWLDETDLRFDDDELACFARHRGIDPENLGETGGWPAMAELVAGADHRLAGTYMWEEVLEPLGASRREVLAVLCDLGGGDDHLLSSALGEAVDLAKVLDGVPLISRGADGWYRPHALWRSAPGLELERSTRREARTRAIEHLSRRRRFDEAFDLIQKAGMWDAAPALLRSACLSSDRLAPNQLRRWAARSAAAVRSPTVGLLVTGMQVALTCPANAVVPLEEAVRMARLEGDVDAGLAGLAQLGRLAWFRQDVEALSDVLAQVAEIETTGHPVARAWGLFGRAMAADLVGDDEAVLMLLDGIEPSVLDQSWEVLASILYSQVSLDRGDLDAIHRMAERLAPVAEPTLRAVVDALELSAWWAEGRVDDVLARIPAAEAALAATGSAYIRYVSLTGAASAYGATGDAAAARRCLDEAADLSPAAPPGTLTVRSAIGTAQTLVAEGDEAAAAGVLQAAIDGQGLDHGVDRRNWRQNLSLSYILLPQTRRHWDAAPLRGHLLGTRELAQAVVALREGRADALRQLDVPPVGVVRSRLHFRFAAELAVGLFAAGRDEGRALLVALGAAGRAAVRALAVNDTKRARAAKSLLAAVPAAPALTTYVAVLGPLVLRRGRWTAGDAREGRSMGALLDEVNDPELRRKKLQELFAFLVGHRRTNRAAIAAALWPDLDERAAGNNLAVTLNHLLRVLEPERATGEPSYLVRLEGPSVRLVTGCRLHVDVDDFDRHVARAAEAESEGLHSVVLEHDLAAVELYRGDLHSEIPEAEWFNLDREHYRARFMTAAIRAGRLLLGRGDLDHAETVAYQALAVDPWCEPAYGILVSSALTRDDRTTANRLLRRCTGALADLGAQPSEATLQLQRRILDLGQQ